MDTVLKLTPNQMCDIAGNAFEQTQALIVMAHRLAYMPLVRRPRSSRPITGGS